MPQVNHLINQDAHTNLTELFSAIESLMIKRYNKEKFYLAIVSHQVNRLILSIQVNLAEIPILFNWSSSEQKRPLNSNHVKDIKSYLTRRIKNKQPWILGSLTANVNPQQISWQPLGFDACLVGLQIGAKLSITDGQHRIQAITELLNSEYADVLNDYQMPLSLIVEDNFEQNNADFQDMAKTSPLPNSLTLAYSLEGQGAIARRVCQQVSLFRNSTRWDSSTTGSLNKYTYTLNFIANLVSCAIAGDVKVDLMDDYSNSQDIDRVASQMSNLLNDFFRYCPHTSRLAAQEEFTVQESLEFRKNSILGRSVGLEILGYLLYECRLLSQKPIISIQELATKIDWSYSSDWWTGLLLDNSDKLTSQYSVIRQHIQTCIHRLTA